MIGLQVPVIRRSGFIRAALRHGLPLVPTFGFGQNKALGEGPTCSLPFTAAILIFAGFAWFVLMEP